MKLRTCDFQKKHLNSFSAKTMYDHLNVGQYDPKDRSSLPEVFCKKCVLRDFTKFIKTPVQSLFFNKVAGQTLAPGVSNNTRNC